MSAVFNFFYLYDPWLWHFFRMAFFVGGIAIFALVYYLYCQSKVRIESNKSSMILPQGIALPIDSIVVIIALILAGVLPMLVHNTGELGVVKMYAKTLILFLFGVAIYNLFYHHNLGKAQCVRDMNIGIVIQAVIGFVALTGLSLAIDLALSTNVMLPRFYGSEQEYRLYNITSSAFFQLSIFYLFLLHFLLAYHAKGKGLSPIILFLLLCIGVISGRTFFVFSVLSILLYFKWRYLPALIVFVVMVLVLAMNFDDNKYVAHALEPVINLLSTQDVTKLSSSSENLVKNHLFIPTMKQILVGDGYYFTPDGRYYGGTDSGFLRQVLYGGAGYLFICFLFTVYFIKRIADNWFDGSYKFLLSTLFLLSILHIKADTYAFPGLMFVLIMFLSLFGQNGKMIYLFRPTSSNKGAG